MKIGFYFECGTKSGGAYQYALSMLETLKTIAEHEYVVFNLSADFPYELVKLSNWQVIDLIPKARHAANGGMTAAARNAPPSLRRRLNLFGLETLRKLRLYRLEIMLTSRNARRRAKKFSGRGIDLMIYHGPSELSFLTDIPGIVPIHDIEHRLHKGEFPELSDKGQWAKREYLFTNIAKRAWRILVDSEVSKDDVSREYGVNPEKIIILPFIPTLYLKKDVDEKTKTAVRAKFNLPEKFVYYPAQFWPHKNHKNIVEAIALLKTKGLAVNAIFTGGTQDLWGEYDRVLMLIKKLDLENQIKFLGFVNADEISVLYKTAEAMVMPVLMGPTYIPVYEAWHMGCPVIYSNIRGPREQAGDAALLCDPHKPEEIAAAIKKIWNNPILKDDLVRKGYARLNLWTWADFCRKMRAIIASFEQKK